MKKKISKKFIKNTIFIILGNFLFALVLYTLVQPSGIVVGGFTGLGLMIERLVPEFHAEWFILAANIVLFIFGWIVLGKKLVLTSALSSILTPVFMAIFRYIPFLDNITSNTLLATIIGGAGVGASIGLLIRSGASTGGTDIINLALSKWFHKPVSYFVMFTECIIISSQIFASGIEMILYGLIYTIIETFVLKKVMLLGQSQIQVMVISDKIDEIRDVILNELKCGVTMLQIETGCRGEKQQAALCVIHPRSLYEVQNKLLMIDPEAFIIVSEINEVRGQGFTTEKKDLIPITRTKESNE